LRILFLCTANSCRSQMAEAWGQRLMPSSWDVRSAGLLTYPITDETRVVMAEAGLDMEGQESKSIDQFDLDEFDLVVSLSEEAGRFMPALTRPERHLARPIDDPMQAVGSPEEVLAAFREARDRIRALVLELGSVGEQPKRDPPAVAGR
jgi:arsenate reductase